MRHPQVPWTPCDCWRKSDPEPSLDPRSNSSRFAILRSRCLLRRTGKATVQRRGEGICQQEKDTGSRKALRGVHHTSGVGVGGWMQRYWGGKPELLGVVVGTTNLNNEKVHEKVQKTCVRANVCNQVRAATSPPKAWTRRSCCVGGCEVVASKQKASGSWAGKPAHSRGPYFNVRSTMRASPTACSSLCDLTSNTLSSCRFLTF